MTDNADTENEKYVERLRLALGYSCRDRIVEECAQAAYAHIRKHGPNGVLEAIRALSNVTGEAA